MWGQYSELSKPFPSPDEHRLIGASLLQIATESNDASARIGRDTVIAYISLCPNLRTVHPREGIKVDRDSYKSLYLYR